MLVLLLSIPAKGVGLSTALPYQDDSLQDARVDSLVNSLLYEDSDPIGSTYDDESARNRTLYTMVDKSLRLMDHYLRDSTLNSQEILEKAIAKLEQREKPLGLVLLHLKLSETFEHNGNPDKMIHHGNLAAEIAENIDNPKARSIAYLSLSWFNPADGGRRLEYRIAMVNLLEESGLIGEFPEAYRFLGDLYGRIFQDAGSAKWLENYEKFFNIVQGNDSLKIVKYMGRAYDIKQLEISKAMELTRLGRSEEARRLLDEYAALRPHLSGFDLALYLDAEGQYYAKQGSPEKAIPYFLESYDLFYVNEFFGRACYLAIFLAEAYLETGEYEKGINYGLKGYELALDNLEVVQIRSSAVLAQLYDKMGNLPEALKYYKINRQIEQEFNRTALMNRIAGSELSQMREQSRIDRINTENQKRWLYGMLAGFLVIAGFSFFLWRSNRQKKLANTNLVHTLNDLRATQQQLIQSEKMASLGELTAGIAHEIQNPLNFVNNFSEVSQELIDEMKEEIKKKDYDEVGAIADDLKQNLEKINHHGKRADNIVKGMLQHSRSSDGKKEPTDLNKLADEYLRLAYHGMRAKDKAFNADIQTEFDDSVGMVEVVPQDIGRVLLNLLTNAFHAVSERKQQAPEGFAPRVTVRTRKTPDGVEIAVTDNGNGIPEHIREKIFQPFFTTKPTGEGTGLGLSMSYDIVTKGHGGTLEVKTTEGTGSEFILNLPIMV